MRDVTDELTDYYDQELPGRAHRPLADDRERIVHDFAKLLRVTGAESVLEVGCGAGRDGSVLNASGVSYRGCDLSPVGVQTCRDLGLDAKVASATDLPYADDEFDAAWSMSTLMHLPGSGLIDALRELRRVVRTDGLVEIGVWGADRDGEWTGDPGGRYFLHRSDDSLRCALMTLGRIDAFDTWADLGQGAHYQWARVVVAPTR